MNTPTSSKEKQLMDSRKGPSESENSGVSPNGLISKQTVNTRPTFVKEISEL